MTSSARSPIALAGKLTTTKIVVMVVAAAAPMGAMLGIVPLGFALGAGAATPLTYLSAGVTLLLFSVGYAAMSRRFTHSGAFYTYVARGLGRPPAVAASLIAIVGYNALTFLLAAGIGYFGQIVVADLTGVSLPWPVYSAFGVLAVGFLGFRRTDLAAWVLGILLVLEVGALLVLDVAVLVAKGWSAFPIGIFDLNEAALTGSLGLGLLLAFQSFLGFESAALYGEETANPRKSIPRATYLSVILISMFYFLTTWITVGAVGAADVAGFAQANEGTMYFVLSTEYVSPALTVVIQLVLLTSLFASMLALHNAASRYLFTAGRARILPSWIGVAHRTQGTPSRASLVQTTANVLVVSMFAISGLDPYLNLATSMTGLGTLALLLLQAVAAVAIVAFFVKSADRKIVQIVAPAASFVVFSIVVALTLQNFRTLTGVDSPIINSLPWVLLAVGVFGFGYGLWLRAVKPATNARIGIDSPDGAESLPGRDG